MSVRRRGDIAHRLWWFGSVREPLMIQLITADFFDFTFWVVVIVAIAIAIFIVWKNKQ